MRTQLSNGGLRTMMRVALVAKVQSSTPRSKFLEAHAKVQALLAAVIRAGSWKKYLHEPRARLDTLRVLCSRGRATPPPGPLARLFQCDAPCAGSVRARHVVPLGVFRTILCFWRSDRDELPPVPNWRT